MIAQEGRVKHLTVYSGTPLLFRGASGAFYRDRWKAVAEGAANLVLSLTLVNARAG